MNKLIVIALTVILSTSACAKGTGFGHASHFGNHATRAKTSNAKHESMTVRKEVRKQTQETKLRKLFN